MPPKEKKKSNRKDDPGHFTAPCCCRVFLVVFLIIAFILTAIGIFLTIRYQHLFMRILSQKMPLSPTSATFGNFKDPPANIYMGFRFFNVTNPDAVANGSKPILQEIGPYVYKNRRVKENIYFNDEFTEIFYDERKYFEFDAEKSTGTENDTFIQLDLVGYNVLKQAYESGVHMLLGRTFNSLKRGSPFKEHRVADFLFGATDPLLAKILPQKFPDPASRPPATFGILIDRKTGKSKNGTFDATYVLNTGKEDFSKFGKVVRYNNISQYANIWPTEGITDAKGDPLDPNIINGTLGTGFLPGVTKDTVLQGFAPDLCLSLGFIFKTPSKLGNLDTLRFTINVPYWRKLVGNLNRGMCAPQDRKNFTKCMQDGVLNVTTCRGAPMIMSLPHLMQADPFYQNMTEGLLPDDEKHSIFLDIDPLTGAALKVAKRMQMNVMLTQIPFLRYTNLTKFTLLPLMWIEESGGITPAGLATLQKSVHGMYGMLKSLSYGLLIAGVCLIPTTALIYLVFRHVYNKKKAQQEAAKSENNDSTSNKRQSPNDGSSVEKRPLK